MKRFILLLGVAAFALAGLVWIASDRRASQRIYDDYSSPNTSKTGLSLASGYLARGRKVGMLTRPLGREPLEANAVVFRVVEKLPLFFDPEALGSKYGPPRPQYAPLLNADEEAFVRGGGRFVVAAAEYALEIVEATDGNKARKVFPIWPRVGELTLPKPRGLAGLPPRMHALYTAGRLAVISRERIGAGELFLISAPEMFQNENLAQGGHLELLAALAGTNRPVYFDEVPHGIVSGDGPVELLKEWSLGPFLLLVLLVAALYFWRNGKRVGPPEEDFRDTRSDAVDLVRSLGALYEEVTTDAEALRLYHESLTRTVAMQSGLRGAALHKRVDELTGRLVPPRKDDKLTPPEFRRQLDSLNEAFRKVERRLEA